MKQNLVRRGLMAGVLVAVQGLSAPVQNGQSSTPSPPASATPQLTGSASIEPVTAKVRQGEPSEPAASSATQYSPGVDEILKMVQAGVSKDVMKAYIETAQVTSHLSAADLVTLKEHGVPDDLTVALLKRGAELAAQANRASVSNVAPARISGTASLDASAAALRMGQLNAGYFDPEGYDYFRHYYLYPRTLAAANQRLFSSPSFSMYPSYPAGYWSLWAFRPRPFAPRFVGP